MAGNVLKEICEPVGALIKASRFELGDPTLNLLEIWGAEYQESNAILIKSEDVSLVQELGEREKCPVSFVGEITDTGKVNFIHSHETFQWSNLVQLICQT